MAVYKPTARSNVTPGDVVIYDADNDLSVITTTVACCQNVAGVCAETIVSGNPVIVESDGDEVIVNVAAGTVNGQWLITHTVAGQAIGIDIWRVGVFAKARSDVGTPEAGQCYAAVAIGWQENEHLHMVPGPAVAAHYTGRQFSAEVGALDANSALHMLDFSKVGTTDGHVIAIGTHPGIGPIHQHTGVFATPDQATPDAYAGRFPDGGAWTDALDGETILVDNDDAILIGAVGPFSLLEVILTTPASVDAKVEFFYYDTSPAWIEFFPDDNTLGFRHSGLIEWDSGEFTNWKSDYDPGAGDTAAGRWIKIVRTKPVLVTTPIVDTIKLLEPTLFAWGPTGNINCNDLAISGALTMSGTLAALVPELNNETGVLIAAGKAIYLATTGSLEIALASNAASGTALVRGVTAEAIADGASGRVVFVGPLVTGAWAEGERGFPVYLSTAGDMTVSRPAAEAIISIIGFVLDTDTIYVNPTMDYIYG